MDDLSWLFLSKVLIVLSTVLLGILGFAFILKRMGYGKSLEAQGAGIKIKAQRHLNTKQKLAIVHWPHGDLLVGISADGLQVLDKHSTKKEPSSKDSKAIVISEFKHPKTSGKH